MLVCLGSFRTSYEFIKGFLKGNIYGKVGECRLKSYFSRLNRIETASVQKETNLKNISGYLLFFGICLSEISFFATVIIRDMRYTSFVSYTYDWSFERVLSALIPAIGILIISIVTRIFLKVISEISISLKKIRMRKTI